MLYAVQKDSFRTPLAANHAAHHVKRRKVEKVVHATTTATATLMSRLCQEWLTLKSFRL